MAVGLDNNGKRDRADEADSPVSVAMGARSYEIVIRDGALDRAGEYAAQAIRGIGDAGRRAAAIVTNPEIGALYAERLARSLTQAGFDVLPAIALHAGERYKTLASVERVYRRLYDAKMDRRGVVIALGGGVVGDIAGFVAASYLRGVDLVQVPTTLLAQVDSSVGGKVGVNYRQAKNSIGAFYQPKAVVIDPGVLATLPRRERLSGLAEVIKYGIIADATLFARLREEISGLLSLRSDYLAAAIARSCRIKARIVEQDEHETSGLRATLNFGHTIGHALEAVTNYRRYTHGEAIAIGMLSAALIGEKTGVSPAGLAREIAQVLEMAGFNLRLDDALDIDEILALLSHDKKSVSGEARFVLIDRLGSASSGHAVALAGVREALLEQRAWLPAVK